MMRGLNLRMALHSMAILFCSCLLPSALAQTETGAISGRVTDHSGAVVSNALLHLVNIDQALRRARKRMETACATWHHRASGIGQIHCCPSACAVHSRCRSETARTGER
jgi:hypothetical protein